MLGIEGGVTGRSLGGGNPEKRLRGMNRGRHASDVPPTVKWTAAVIAGGGIAGLTQGLTGVLRALSTVLTGGLGNPVIATAELVGALVISFLALAAPAAAIALVILFLLVAIRLLRRLFRAANSPDSRT